MLYLIAASKITCVILTIHGIVQLFNRFVNEMPHLSNGFYTDLAFMIISHILSVIVPEISMAIDIILLIIRFIRYIIKEFSSR
jgi:hypothetical protein|nr:MAG TPA: hypothetical protein [Caudoviricetes sp.]